MVVTPKMAVFLVGFRPGLGSLDSSGSGAEDRAANATRRLPGGCVARNESCPCTHLKWEALRNRHYSLIEVHSTLVFPPLYPLLYCVTL
jgi:hypothetical protein